MKNPIIALFRARDKPGKQQSAQNAVSAATTFSFGGSSGAENLWISFWAISSMSIVIHLTLNELYMSFLPLGKPPIFQLKNTDLR